MPENNNTALHVYEREISNTERSSLSVLAGLIAPQDASVLDLGLGSGALGRHLVARGAKAPDGVTYNPAEADLARPHYGRVEVADLEQADLPTMFAGQRYDFIVCADVLEHLRQPERVMAACRELLTPTGQVLISVPNVGYAGLMGELMAGEFKYRPEGLLDNTHLRFFTRRSMQRFLQECGWHAVGWDTVARELPDSEFAVAFDKLPPPVARHLLSLPDALSYQFIVQARPGAAAGPLAEPPEAAAAQATFSVYLYLRHATGFDEQRKLLARGVIGEDRQRVEFTLPDDGRPVTALRLDPADRPGFLQWHALRLRSPAGETLWRWTAQADGVQPLLDCPQQDMLMRPPWPLAAGVVCLLHGDDPWIELPLGDVLARLGPDTAGCALEVEFGWPMSADYLALTHAISPLKARIGLLEDEGARARDEIGSLSHELAQWKARHEEQRQRSQSLQAQLVEEEAQRRRERQDAADRHAAARAETRGVQRQHDKLQREFNELAQHLKWIEGSTVFRATRPLVNLKVRVDRLRGKGGPAPQPAATPAAAASQARPVPAPSSPVDVIVPVYRGLEDTRRCILSVLESSNKTPMRLVVINDASPEPEVTDWLREVQAGHPDRIELLENPENLGFVGTVNRGMALHPGSDVLLLNSDAEVANDWLDRLQAAAYSDARIASVTPFSNNATICSYPRFCEANDLPQGWDTAALDSLFARANPPEVVDVPTGVGFCMYIRRDSLDELGLFDTANFGKGYGEENDFCCRAREAGWRNVHAVNVFARHAGGVSFGASKSARELAAMETLRRLHPRYEAEVHAFLARDPARLYRLRADIERVRHAGLPTVLAVLHDRAGGTRRHAEELAAHLAGRASFLLLVPMPGERVGLRLPSAQEGMELVFQLPLEWDDLLAALRALGVAHVHYHHLIGHGDLVLSLAEGLRTGYDFTAHDYYTFCPQISLTGKDNRYCGEQGVEQCDGCLKRSPAPGGLDIQSWRAKYLPILQGARHVLAPSRDAARRLVRAAPGADVRLAPHTDLPDATALPAPAPRPLQPGAALKIAVIGALSPIKGADLLDDVAREAAHQGLPLDFHLLGYAYRHLATQPRSRLTVHGAYEEADLPELLAWLQPDLVWFPAQWPETYSYTLSACLQAGLPVVAPDLGAFEERLAGRAWTWVRHWDAKPAQWLAFFSEVRERHFVPGRGPAAVHALAPADADDRIGAWTYQSDYLRNIEALPAEAALGDDFLLGHQARPDPGLAGAVHGVKRGLLPLLVRLRSLPGLGRVARAIPLRWQTRVKTWLRK